MAASLGEKLRLAREAKGMELRDVADNTRIAINYLAAIEDDNYKPLPGGVFNEGFVRSFAKAVGVDEKEALSDYNQLVATQMPPVDENQLTRRPDVYTNDNTGSPLTKLFGALVLLALLGAGIYFGLQFLQSRSTNVAAPVATPVSDVNANVAAAPAPTATLIAEPINVQLKAVNGDISITPSTDGNRQSDFILRRNQTRDMTAQQSIRISYHPARANYLQMTVNGKPVNVLKKSLDPRSNLVEMEITRDNLAQYLQ